MNVKHNKLKAQQHHWETTLIEKQNAFGEAPSEAAIRAADLFQTEGCRSILEIGGGQGRDAIFFAALGFQVIVVEYTQSGVDQINKKAEEKGISQNILTILHNVREPLPVETNTVDACFSHMLLCMAFTESELHLILEEIRRVTAASGFYSFTARTIDDPQYKLGEYHGENLYEHNGFIVHFFNQKLIDALIIKDEVLERIYFTEGPRPKKLVQITARVQ